MKKYSRFMKRFVALALTVAVLLSTNVFCYYYNNIDCSITANARTIDIHESGVNNRPLINISITSAKSFTYDGTQKKVTVQVRDSFGITSDYTIKGNTGTNVGTYTVTASSAVNSISTTWTITKASNTLTYTSAQSVTKTFSTDKQTATLSAATKAQGALSYTISSQKTSSGAAVSYFTLSGTTLTISAGTPAGTYKVAVKAAAAGNSNYYSANKTSTVTVIVNKANITPSVTMDGWTYGDTPNDPIVSGNTGEGDVTYEYKVSTADDSTYTNTKPSDAGTYTVRATVDATANYNGGSATTDFTISQANITPTVTLISWEYGSTPNEPSVSGNSGNGTVTYSYKVSTADDSTYTSEKPTEIGNYTVRAVIGETTNYNGAAVTDDFEITKGILNPSVSLDGWTYGENANTPTVTGNTGNGQVVYQYSVQGANSYSDEIPTNAGSYTVKAIIGETEKYLGGEATCDFTIAPADSSATAPAPIEGLVYNGNEQTLVTAGTAQGGEMQYSLDGITYSPTLPAGINAGEYTVYYKVVGDSNHNDTAPAAVTVTISPAAALGNTKPSLVNFTLDGIIGANFYYPSELDSRITKIQFNITNSTAGDQTETISIDRNNTADVNGTTYLKVTCPITIDKLYGGKITATGQDDNKNVLGQSRTLNIDKYVAAVNSGSYEDSMKAVVTTMQQYSRCAQEYTHKPETLTALSSLNSDKTAITQAASKRVYIPSQLILGEAVTMRIYVGGSEPTVSDTAAYFKKEYALSTGSNENGYYIEVENVPAFAMLHGFKLDYTVGGESQSITYYPITYLAQLVDVSQGFDEYTQNLACALYEYAVAVDAQFFSENAA